MSLLDEKPRINAKNFQEPLAKLTGAVSQLVMREGHRHLPAPEYVSQDIFMMVRHALATYNLLFYINADERRKNDCYWNPAHGVVTAPLVRTMIDCLYNITAILQNPAERGVAYRKAGLKRGLDDIKEDEENYRGLEEWDEYNAKRKAALGILIRGSRFNEQEIEAAKAWPTLGGYIRGDLTKLSPHQRFLKKFTYLQWRQYSALSHGGFEGYIGELPSGAYFATDFLPHEQRPKVEAMYEAFLTRHIGLAATVLLCLVTEIQAHFRFEGADLDSRIQKMWKELMGLFEAKELYDEHYCELMKGRGIIRES